MNKMREYERGREDGLDLARRITREGGLKALEKECRFRGVTGIHTSLARKDLDKASEKIKQLVSECCVIMAIAVFMIIWIWSEKMPEVHGRHGQSFRLYRSGLG